MKTMKKEHELLEAARTGNIELVEKLLTPVKSISWSLASLGLKARVNVNCHDASGYTPLHHAALNGHRNVVKVLLENSASTNVGDIKGSFPLHLAAWSGNHEIVELLLNHGPSIAKVNEKNGDDETPLHCAAQHGHAEAAEVLLKSGADSSIRNMRGESPLDLASQYGRLGVVRLLLYHQPSLLKRFPETFSPLHVASRNGHKQIVELLIAHGADVNRNGENGTALHEAALFGKIDVVKLLLTRGANPYALDPQNRTSLELVKQLDTQTSREISQLILGRMQDGDDYFPLSPNPAQSNARGLRTSHKRDFFDGRRLPEPDTSVEKPKISVEEHYIAPDSQPTVVRSHTFKGFVRSWNRSSARKAVFRRSASVRNSKSLPRLPSSRFPSTTASPELSRQFHPSSTMFPVSPTRPSPLHLSVLSLPAAISSHQSSRSFDCEKKITGTSEHPEDDSVFLTTPLLLDAPNPPTPTPHPSSLSSVTHRLSTPPSNTDPPKTVHPPVPSSPCLNESQLKQSPFGQGESFSPGQKPKKPVRQKLSTVTSPPPVPPKPAHLCQKRPPSPSLPPPVDEDFSGEDETTEIGEGEHVADDAIHVCKNQFDIQRLLEPGSDPEVGDKPPASPPPPSPYSAMIEVSEALQDVMALTARGQHASNNQTEATNAHTMDAESIDDVIRDSSRCFVKREIREARIMSAHSVDGAHSYSDVATPPVPLQKPPFLLLQEVSALAHDGAPQSRNSASSVNSLLDDVTMTPNKIDFDITPPTSSGKELNRTSPLDDSASAGASLSDHENTSISTWEDNLSDRTEDFEMPPKLRKFRGLTRGSSCRNARSIFDLPDRYMDDSDGYGASDDGVADRGCADATACKEKTPSYDEGAPSVHDSDDARSRDVVDSFYDNNSGRGSSDAGSIGKLPDLDAIKDTVAAVRSRSQRGSESGSSSSTMAKAAGEDEWTQIANAMVPRGGGLNRGDVYAKEFEETFWKIMTGSSFPRSLGGWLADLGLSQYEEVLSANGFDDPQYMGGGILGEKDLIDMDIPEESHRNKILDAAKTLPQPYRIPSHAAPPSVAEWLSNLRLSDYKDAFAALGLNSMAQVPPKQLRQFFSKRGHFNRAMMSLDTRDCQNADVSSQNETEITSLSVEEAKKQLIRGSVHAVESLSSSSHDSHACGSARQSRDLTAPMIMNDLASPGVPDPDRALFLVSHSEGIQLRPPNEATREVSVSAWRHSQDALINGSCNYQAYYLGSMLIQELKGVDSTKEACAKMKKSTIAMKKMPTITLAINYQGVKFIDFRSKNLIAEHEIQNISFASQDALDLSTLAYITHDVKTGHHYCHVFRVATMDAAYEIILTLGQAFEVAYQLILKEKSLKVT